MENELVADATPTIVSSSVRTREYLTASEIERIERDAHADPRIRLMLCGVWQTSEVSDALWARIDALLADYRPEDREGRGQSPGLRRLREQGLWQGVPFPGGKERIAGLYSEWDGASAELEGAAAG